MVAELERHPTGTRLGERRHHRRARRVRCAARPGTGATSSPPGASTSTSPPTLRAQHLAEQLRRRAFLYRDRVAALLGRLQPLPLRDRGLRLLDAAERAPDAPARRLRRAGLRIPLLPRLAHRPREEIGITRSRGPLMVFDDFRRDFCSVAPGVVGGERGRAAADALLDALRREVERAGHLWLEGNGVGSSWPRLWAPLVHARIEAPGAPTRDAAGGAPASSTGAGAPPLDRLPTCRTRRSACCSSPVEHRPTSCSTRAGTSASRPRRAGRVRRRGLIVASDPGVLFAAVDVRSRSHQLDRVEQEIHQPPAPRSRSRSSSAPGGAASVSALA